MEPEPWNRRNPRASEGLCAAGMAVRGKAWRSAADIHPFEGQLVQLAEW